MLWNKLYIQYMHSEYGGTLKLLEVKNLCKDYGSFALRDVSFTLPRGYIMGFIGMNGAGKSTTLKSILNIVRPDSGSVHIFGKDMATDELEIKQKVSFTLGAFDYYPNAALCKIADVYRKFYREWSGDAYRGYLDTFGLDEKKKVRELSAGMKVKFALALALSHNAELFLFDEPTSGLDPIARNELLDIFQSIVEDGQKSILFSTHITSDLDKCADYIVFIREGNIIAESTKDDLIANHALLAGRKADLTEDLKARLISYKAHGLGFTGLIRRADLRPGDAPEISAPNLEDIMVYYNREERK